MVKRIQFLAEKGLTSMIVMFNLLSKCVAPLQQRVRLGSDGTGPRDGPGPDGVGRNAVEAELRPDLP
jgi:hypothetical protein